MGIQPPSDLIVDVINAADPAKAQAMASRLRQASFGTNSAAASGAFGAEMQQVGLAPEMLSVLGPSSSASLSNATALSQKGAAAGKGKTLQQFEAMVLSTFVQNMMPAKASSVFGSGTAGDMWRTMLSQNIGSEVAKAGGIGIANRISASIGRTSVMAMEMTPPATTEQTAPAASGAPAAVAKTGSAS